MEFGLNKTANINKLQFIYNVNDGGSKTAKIIKMQYSGDVIAVNIAFYDCCGF